MTYIDMNPAWRKHWGDCPCCPRPQRFVPWVAPTTIPYDGGSITLPSDPLPAPRPAEPNRAIRADDV